MGRASDMAALGWRFVASRRHRIHALGRIIRRIQAASHSCMYPAQLDDDAMSNVAMCCLWRSYSIVDGLMPCRMSMCSCDLVHGFVDS